ncbi:MAG: hypothetical protein HY895_03590 [Deltaproteobacteria bacterium]|nr:hypothetical protein [Deltaproteobacteria bacterium]
MTSEDESLRDGLQSEPKVLRLEDKLTLFRLLAAAGVKRLQVGSFVHPRIVPQMAGTGVDPKALCKAVDAYEALLGRPLPGRMNRVLRSQGSCNR